MSKLDFDLIQERTSRINAIKERELDFRGLKIQRIENMILTKDQNDCINFTGNDIQVLGNFSFMPNLKTLLLANNRIKRIENDIAKYVPNLKVLILSNNALEQMGELDPLTHLNLQVLSCIDNLIYNFKYYRLYVIHKCPSIRILDFKKVKDSERKQAMELFSGQEGIALLKKLSLKNTTLDDSEVKVKKGPSKEEQEKIKEAIRNAKSLSEIAKLEQQLAGGGF